MFRAFGGIIGMAICNDRRWPETYRVMGLQGAEMVVLGYNTPVHNPPSPEHDHLAHFHNELVMQAGAYQNGCWVVGVAKAGDEDGVRQIGNSIIVAPSGEIVAACVTEGDELAIARCDLDLTLVVQEHDLQFRPAPPAAGVRTDRRAQGSDTAAAGVMRRHGSHRRLGPLPQRVDAQVPRAKPRRSCRRVRLLRRWDLRRKTAWWTAGC